MKTLVKEFRGKRLKELIKRKGITQETFAMDLGVSKQTITYWITGKKLPSSYNLECISDYFDIPQVCLTDGYPLCTKKQYTEFSERMKKNFFPNIIIDVDEIERAFFEYLMLFGKKYSSFDFERLDLGVINGRTIFRQIKDIVNEQIENCFLEFGVIESKEENADGNNN